MNEKIKINFIEPWGQDECYIVIDSVWQWELDNIGLFSKALIVKKDLFPKNILEEYKPENWYKERSSKYYLVVEGKDVRIEGDK